MLCAASVQNGTRVNFGRDFKGNSGREVGLDDTGNDIDRRTLRSNDQVNTNGARQLGQTRNRRFHLLAGGHNEVGKLVDDQNNVGEVAVAFFRVELAADKFLVVLLDVANHGILQQLVAVVHFDTQRIQRVNDLGGIRNDGLVRVRKFGQEVALNLVVERQFYFLGVYEDKLHFRRVLLVEDGGQQGVQTYRLALARSTRHEQVGHLGQIRHKNLVANGLAQRHRKVHRGVLEFLRGQDRLHAHHLGTAVGDFNTNGAAARNGCNDADAQRTQTQCDIVFQAFNLRNPNPRLRYNLVQRDRRTHGCFDFGDFNLVVAQGFDDALFVGFEFFGVHLALALGNFRQ